MIPAGYVYVTSQRLSNQEPDISIELNTSLRVKNEWSRTGGCSQLLSRNSAQVMDNYRGTFNIPNEDGLCFLDSRNTCGIPPKRRQPTPFPTNAY